MTCLSKKIILLKEQDDERQNATLWSSIVSAQFGFVQ